MHFENNEFERKNFIRYYIYDPSENMENMTNSKLMLQGEIILSFFKVE